MIGARKQSQVLAQQGSRIVTAAKVMRPGDFPVASRGLGLTGKRFVAGAVQRLIIAGPVLDQIRVAGGQQRFEAPRRIGMQTGELIERLAHSRAVVQPARTQ